MKYHVLLTGGAGFIGSHTGCELLKRGHTLTVLDNLDPYYDTDSKRANLEEMGKFGEYEFIEGDILDRELLGETTERNDLDVIMHLAAQPGIRSSLRDPFKTYRTNIEGTMNILDAAVRAGVPRLINASSSSVYGNNVSLPFLEAGPCEPASPYGVSKKTAEDYCRVFDDIHGLNVVSLRYFTVYGPRIRPDLAVCRFTDRARRGEPIEIFGTGEQSRDLTYIDDVVKANIMFMDHDGSGVYNVGSGSNVTVNELAERIISITNSKSEIQHGESIKGEAYHTLASVDLIGNEIGWKPSVTLDDGLPRYVDSLVIP